MKTLACTYRSEAERLHGFVPQLLVQLVVFDQVLLLFVQFVGLHFHLLRRAFGRRTLLVHYDWENEDVRDVKRKIFRYGQCHTGMFLHLPVWDFLFLLPFVGVSSTSSSFLFSFSFSFAATASR